MLFSITNRSQDIWSKAKRSAETKPVGAQAHLPDPRDGAAMQRISASSTVYF